MMNKTSRSLVLGCSVLLAGALTLTGCSLTGNSLDKSTAKTADSGREAKAEGLAPGWLPDEAKKVKEQIRSTGDERLLATDFGGSLPDTCSPLATAGQPSDEEIKTSYAQDEKTKGAKNPAQSFTTSPTLSAEWWPSGQEKKTTTLCGRWWVSQDDGKLYAFAPEQTKIAKDLADEKKK